MLDDQSRRRGASLPGGAERSPERAVHRELHIGVVEHHDGVLAAELERALLEHPAAGLGHDPPGVDASREVDRSDVGMRDERRSRLLAEAEHDVDHADREPRVLERFDEPQRAQRRVLGRLDHHRIAGHDRREDLPGRDGDREVPRRDAADDAERLAHGHRPLVAQLARHRLAERAATLAGDELPHVDCFLDVAPSLGEHLAHLPGHELRERLLAVLEQLGGTQDDRGARRPRRPPPAVERCSRAAATAASTSAASLRENTPTTSPLFAGLRDSKVRPDPAGRKAPLIRFPTSRAASTDGHRAHLLAHRGLEDVQARVQLGFGNRERRDQPDHVPIDTTGEQQQSAGERVGRDSVDERGRGSAALHEFEADHHAKAAHVGERGNVRLPSTRTLHDTTAEPVRPLRDPVARHGLDHGDRRRARNRVATVRRCRARPRETRSSRDVRRPSRRWASRCRAPWRGT